MFLGNLAYAPSGSFGVYETSWPQLCIALTVFVAFAVAVGADIATAVAIAAVSATSSADQRPIRPARARIVPFIVAPSLPSCMVGPFLPGTRWDVDRIGFDRWRSYAITQPAFAAVDRDRREDRE